MTVQSMSRAALSSAIITALLCNAAPAIVIDDFSVGPVMVDGPSGTAAQTGLDPSHVIGGRRDIFVEHAGDRAQVETGKGRFHFTTDAGDFGYVRLTYGQGGPLGVDFTAQGHDRIRFRFVDVTNTGIFWTYVNTTLPPSSNGLELQTAIRALGSYGIIEVPYSLYNADFTNVSNFVVHDIRVPANSHYAIEEIVTAGPPLAGDYNRNGTVDDADYFEWRRLVGKSVGGGLILGPDGNEDGRVDAADYVLWRKNYGTTGAAAPLVASVPEPSAASLSWFAGMALLRLRRRKG